MPAAAETISISEYREGSEVVRRKLAHRATAIYARQRVLRVVDHGIPEEFLRDIPAIAGPFFAQEVEAKLPQLARSGLGYLPSPDSLSLPVSRNPNSAHEQFIAHLDERRTPWPDVPQRFRHIVSGYCREAERLCRTLAEIMAVGSDLPADAVREPADAPNSSFIKFIAWRSPEESLRLSEYRLAPHYDNAAVSVLHNPTEANGLQVLTEDGWAEAFAGPGELLVLFGEQMTRWTNGRVTPAWHQVVNHSSAHHPGDGSRLSSCYFYNPAPMVEDVELYLAGRAKYCAACEASLRGEIVTKQTWTRRFRLNSA